MSTNGTPLSSETPFANVPAVSRSLQALQQELDDLDKALQHIHTSKAAAEEATEGARRVQAATEDLTGSVGALVQRIEAVDFPSRFASMEQTIGTVTDDLDASQKNLKSAIERHGNQQQALVDRTQANGDRIQQATDRIGSVQNRLNEAAAALSENQSELSSQIRANKNAIADQEEALSDMASGLKVLLWVAIALMLANLGVGVL